MRLRALQTALEHADPDDAQEKLSALQEGESESLDWEVRLLECLQSRPSAESLDTGFRFWQRIQEEEFFSRMPRHSVRELRKNYFRRLLASASPGSEVLRTSRGLSRGYLVLLSGDAVQARRLLEEELDRFGEGASLRINLAHANWQCGERTAARVHFGQALLLGWDQLDSQSILDPELLDSLLDAREPDWAVIECYIERALPIASYPSRQEFESSVAFQKRREIFEAAPHDLAQRRRQFHRCLVISENRRWAEDELLVQSRRRMKHLHDGLHFLYMRSLESGASAA
ncbi:MAG TPA: hypothetical protein VLV83_01120 [Acidobacteriota bacterium]|nr:hypothetical protein [Acidobacteriota bacterium]